MRFLVDAQLPAALARWLGGAGHEAEHVGDVGLLEASDSEIWQWAVQAGAIVVSKDEDFAARRLLESKGPQILWVRLGNTRKGELLVWFEARLPEVEEALARGEPLVELV